MLEVRDVHKRFGELEILRGVSLKVEKGDIDVVIGASGSGKTTVDPFSTRHPSPGGPCNLLTAALSLQDGHSQ